MNKVRGYIFSRRFFDERAPAHIQNIVLRDFCKANNLKLLLSATEYTTKNSTLILFETLKNLQSIHGIVFYSIYQLPFNEILRKNLYSRMLKNKKTLYFATERIIAKNNNDIDRLEKLWLLKKNQSIVNANFNEVKKFYKYTA